jgi:hypothetical protein
MKKNPTSFFSIALHFYFICFGKIVALLSTYIGRPKGRNSILQKRAFYFRELP